MPKHTWMRTARARVPTVHGSSGCACIAVNAGPICVSSTACSRFVLDGGELQHVNANGVSEHRLRQVIDHRLGARAVARQLVIERSRQVAAATEHGGAARH